MEKINGVMNTRIVLENQIQALEKKIAIVKGFDDQHTLREQLLHYISIHGRMTNML